MYTGQVKLQFADRGFYATVAVECWRIDERPTLVKLSPAGAGDAYAQSQGWTEAALAGAELGLRYAGRTALCKVTGIHGHTCDTNATLVAIAAMLAVWTALDFRPDEVLAGRIQAAILRSSEISVADLESALS